MSIRSSPVPAPAHQGRVWWVLATAVLAPGWTASVADHWSDGWWWVVPLVLAIGAAVVLLRELRRQIRRPGGWEGADTANTAILAGLAVLLTAALIFGHAPAPERWVAGFVVALYAALAVTFAWLRRRRVAP